jgi:SAM-dependent methyltransferase
MIDSQSKEEDCFEVPLCIIDKGRNYREYKWGTYHLNLEHPLKVVRCCDCGLLYLCPRPAEYQRAEILHGHIPEELEAYGSSNYDYAAVDQSRREAFKERIARLQRICKKSSGQRHSLLDVGSSGGTVLEVAAEMGWRVTGLEPAPSAAVSAVRKDIAVVQGVAEELPFADDSFSFVHANHVYEHLEDPLQAARESLRVLEPDGALFIEVPNQLDSFSFHRNMLFRRLRQRQRDITSIHHLWFFSRKTLRRVLTEAGFENVKTEDYHPLAKGWEMPFSLVTRLLGVVFWGGSIVRAWGFKRA